MTAQLIPLSYIKIDDTNRQRKELLQIEDLMESIKRIGLLHPIIVDENYILRAGRRRFEAHVRLGYTEILARQFIDLDENQKQLIELDENIRRADITWQERSLAIHRIHKLLRSETIKSTADYIGLNERTIGRSLSIADALLSGDPKVLACNSASQAGALLERRAAQVVDTELSKLMEVQLVSSSPTCNEVSSPNEESPGTHLEVRVPVQSAFSIIQGDFLQFARAFSGPKFNFIHCDFPYGIRAESSKSMGSAGQDSQYEDSPEIFWELTNCLLDNIERLTYDSAHVMFWFSMKYYSPLMERLNGTDLFVHELPLIWGKSDGAGVASDYRRRPKHIYETALWISRGDRFISAVVNDLFNCPTARTAEDHMSAKPEQMLKHFLSMGVNELTEFLDPTCGSGTSLRAAHSLGAVRGLGLEINEIVATASAQKLEEAVRIERARKIVKKP